MIGRMDNNTVLDDIRRSLKNNMPMGGKDWDILVILNKDVLEPSDYDTITFPLTSLGWEIGENISPVMYTQKEWDSNKMTPFYKNVQRDGILLWD